MSAQQTQTERVRQLLQAQGEVSARALLREGITRVAARIWDLKREGMVIETLRGGVLDDGTREMARYRLVPEAERQAEGQVRIW